MKKNAVMVYALNVICLCLFLFAAPAYAGSFGVGLKLGGYFPQSDILEDADTAIALETDFGYKFHPNIAAVFGVGWLQTDVPVNVGPVESDATLAVFPITFDIMFMQNVSDVSFSVYGGPGLYYTELDLLEKESDTVLGHQAGVGAYYKNFGIDVKYIFAEPTLDDVDVELNGLVATLGLRYGF